METTSACARHDLTDGQWVVLEPLLPSAGKPGCSAVHAKRRLIDGIRWRTRAGVRWQDVPPLYGPWQCVLAVLPLAAGLISWDVSVDAGF
ncbi:transposase [Nocardia sp. NPDC005998]|uniref:transposase n=1 Tax=Nocardia sp. NPDC005998 TaxID=3156894 RepID=UPI0033BBEF5A